MFSKLYRTKLKFSIYLLLTLFVECFSISSSFKLHQSKSINLYATIIYDQSKIIVVIIHKNPNKNMQAIEVCAT